MKIFSMLLSVLMAFPLTACNPDAPQPDGTAAPGASSASEQEGAGDPASANVRYEVGDIILADGSAVKPSELGVLDENAPPIAVIAEIKEDGSALGVGVHRSSQPLQWASDGTTGHTAKFAEIVCTDAVTGDASGHDNWSAICSADAQGTLDAAANYPAFSFTLTYAKSCQLPAEYASGWYMPCITELCTIYENRSAIDSALQAIDTLDNDAAMDGLGTVWYWASSQSDSEDSYAWFVHYFNGYAACCPKDFDNLHVLAVRAF